MTLKLCSLSLVLLTIAACGDARQVPDAEQTAAGDAAIAAATSADREPAPAPAPDLALAYAAATALDDMFEIEAAEVALATSSSPQLRQFAQAMVDAHRRSSARLAARLESAEMNLAPPAVLDPPHQTMLDALGAAAPSRFDSLYVDQQIAAHRAALARHRAYAAEGGDPGLKTFAARTATMIGEHLDALDKLAVAGTPASDAAPAR